MGVGPARRVDLAWALFKPVGVIAESREDPIATMLGALANRDLLALSAHQLQSLGALGAKSGEIRRNLQGASYRFALRKTALGSPEKKKVERAAEGEMQRNRITYDRGGPEAHRRWPRGPSARCPKIHR